MSEADDSRKKKKKRVDDTAADILKRGMRNVRKHRQALINRGRGFPGNPGNHDKKAPLV